MPNNSLTQLLNIPDLIILAIFLIQIIMGLRQGFLHTLCKLVGKIIALSLAVVTAKMAAPTVATYIVTPIVGSVFEKQATFSQAGNMMENLQQTVTDIAIKMAESLAFIGIFFLAAILFVWLVNILFGGLKLLSKVPPIGFFNAILGAFLGVISSFVLISLILIGISWFAPITYTSLGYLSPSVVENTQILRFFIDILPVAI